MSGRSRVVVAVGAVIVALVLAMGLSGCAGQRATMDRPAVEGGAIQGVKTDGIWSYLGVPYAAPPVGELRWKPPEPVEPWEGVRSCREYAPSCPQSVQAAAIPRGLFPPCVLSRYDLTIGSIAWHATQKVARDEISIPVSIDIQEMIIRTNRATAPPSQ